MGSFFSVARNFVGDWRAANAAAREAAAECTVSGMEWLAAEGEAKKALERLMEAAVSSSKAAKEALEASEEAASLAEEAARHVCVPVA